MLMVLFLTAAVPLVSFVYMFSKNYNNAKHVWINNAEKTEFTVPTTGEVRIKSEQKEVNVPVFALTSVINVLIIGASGFVGSTT